MDLVPIKIEGGAIIYDKGATSKPKDTSWSELIESEMTKNGDSSVLVRVNGDISTRFSGGYGGVYKAEWVLWTDTHVYIPAIFDGKPSVVSVPRAPSDFIYSIDELGF